MQPRRTFLGHQASRVAWVPTSSAYAASDLALVVAGRGSQDLAGEAGSLVALLRVAVRQPDDSAHLGVTTTQQWRLPGVVNDLQVVAHPHSDAATVLCATSHGTVVRLRLSASAADYSPPDIWLDAAATNGCAVTSLDSDAATQEVVFATRAGALATAALERGGFSATFLQPGGSCTSFAAVRFVGTGGGGHRAAAGGSHVIATVGSAPGCSLFDPLAPPSTGPVLRCPGSSPGQRFSCLAVEPGTSHGALLAAGCSDEPGACVWDTRQPSTPLWTWRQAGGGGAPGAHCTTVAFDPGACFSSTGGEYPMPPRTGAAAATTSTQRTSGLLLATSSGVLVGCTVSKEQQPQVGLARESAPVGHCAVVPGSGQQLAAVTDAECLLLWDARSAGALDAMM